MANQYGKTQRKLYMLVEGESNLVTGMYTSRRIARQERFGNERIVALPLTEQQAKVIQGLQF